MSLFQKFGFKKKKKVKKATTTESVNKTIISLREHVSLLEKKKVHFEKKIGLYNKEAQQCLKKKNRNGALQKIKLRKQVQKRLDNLENQIFNIEMQIMALDETLTNKQMMDSMKIVKQHINNDDMEKQLEEAGELNDDINDALEMQQELAGILGQSFIDYDDDDLEQELLELNDELQDDGLIYSQKVNINNKKQKKKQPVMILEDIDDDDPEDDDEVEQMKKLEMEIAQNANNHDIQNIVDVQIVQSAPKKSNKIMIASY